MTPTSRDDGPTASPPPLSHAVDWASVPSDILACVCKLLSAVPGRVCFRAVCRSWRAVADDLIHSQRAAVARMPPPWVVIPLESGCCEQFTLASVPTMQSFSWTPPGGAGMRCVGSSGGWIAGAYIDGDGKIRLSLLNPLTDARVDVPATLGRVWYMPKSKDYMREEIVLCYAVQKVAFSPSPTEKNFAVAVLTRPRKGNGNVIVFTRSGCNGWCALADPGPFERGGDYIRAQLDVAYHRGKFYYMSMSNTVWVVDMAVRYPKPEPLATFLPPMPRGLLYGRHHLAITGDGAVHVVSSSIHYLSSSGVDMLVQRYDPTSRAEQGSPWVKATCLGGEEAFLVGDMNQTLPVRADGGDGAWLRPGSVYFINIPLCPLLAKSRKLRSPWVLNLAAGDIRQPTQSEDGPAMARCSYLGSNMCAWIMPSMR